MDDKNVIVNQNTDKKKSWTQKVSWIRKGSDRSRPQIFDLAIGLCIHHMSLFSNYRNTLLDLLPKLKT